MLFNLTQEVGELFGREHARLAGLDIPPGGESERAYQAGFKNEKSHIIGVGAPSGIGDSRWITGEVYTEFSGTEDLSQPPLALIGGVQTPETVTPPKDLTLWRSTETP